MALTSGRVRLAWQPPQQATATGYVVEAGYATGATDLSVPVGNTLALEAVAPPATYFVRVRAQTTAGLGEPSNEVSVSTNVAPLTPFDFRARVVGNAVSLQWTENPAGMVPTRYVIRAGSGPGSSDAAVLHLPATARSLDVIAPTGTYFVRLAALNGFGVSQEAGERELSPRPGACSPRLPAPTGLVATTASGQVTINWNAVSGAVGYELIAGSTAGGSDVGRFSLPASQSITASAPARQYFVRLAAISSAGCTSDPSGEISFVVP